MATQAALCGIHASQSLPGTRAPRANKLPPAYYIREAIEKHLEDMEDLYLPEEATRRIQRGESKIKTSL